MRLMTNWFASIMILLLSASASASTIASFDEKTSQLTMPMVKVDSTATFSNVVIRLTSFGVLAVDDPTVATAIEYKSNGNRILLPSVTVGAATFNKVSLTGATFEIVSVGGQVDTGSASDLGSLTASNSGAAQFGTGFAPTTFTSTPSGLGWVYEWSVSATHQVRLVGSTVLIIKGDFIWQRSLAPTAQLTFDAVNGTVSFKDLTATVSVSGGAQTPLVLNGTLRLPPINSGPVTISGTGTSFTGTGFNSPVATYVDGGLVRVWTWQDSRGATLTLSHNLVTDNYSMNYTGMAAAPFLSSTGKLPALGIAIDSSKKTVTLTNVIVANNNTRTSVTLNGVLSIP
jgi:hypothetical protein